MTKGPSERAANIGFVMLDIFVAGFLILSLNIWGVLLVGLAIIPAVIAHRKGRSFGAWWLFGMALLIVALPMAILAKPDVEAVEERRMSEGMKKCPYCAEMIKADAKVCRYCGRDLPAPRC